MRIVASIASIPNRVDSLKTSIESILPHVDMLHVYLNKYKYVPSFLKNRKIIIARSQDYGDNGDAGKFYWSNKIMNCIHFTCDDDITYSKDYFNQMLTILHKYNYKVVISACGSLIKKNKVHFKNYYTDRHSYHIFSKERDDISINIAGTGVMAYHTDVINITPSDFKHPNMADVWFAIVAKEQKVSLIRVNLSNTKNILSLNEIDNRDTIYYQSTKQTNDTYMNTLDMQTKIVRYNYPWT